MQATMFVPSHADAVKDIRFLVDLNKKKLQEIAAYIMSACIEPTTFERVLQRLFVDYHLTMTYEQYVLIGSTVRSYLSWLRDKEKMNAYIENNTLLWQCVTD